MVTSSLINFVFASDNACAVGLGVAVFSLLEHVSRPGDVNLFILDGGIAQEHKARLTDMAEGRGASIQYIDMSGRFLDASVGHLSPAAYYRLLIPEVLPDDVEKVVYADTDLLFLDDVRKLCARDMEGRMVAAVADVFLMQDEDGARLSESLGMRPSSVYFNSGLMVIDRKQLVEKGIVRKFLDYERTHRDRLLFCDQDVINVVLEGDFLVLPPEWNMFDLLMNPAMRERLYAKSLTPYSKGLFEQAAADPKIIHFTGRKKPFHYANKANEERLYLDYLNRSPWRGTPQAGFTWGAAIKKNMRKLRMKVFRKWA